MHLSYLKIIISVFACQFLLLANCFAQELQSEKHMKVAMRMIGHQVLLNSNDSISRVLPIAKNKDQYTIQFASAF